MAVIVSRPQCIKLPINTLTREQNGWHLAVDTFQSYLLNRKLRYIKIWLKFVHASTDYTLTVVYIMARHRVGDQQVPESMSNIVIDEFMRPPPCFDMLKTTLSLARLFLNFVSIISWFTQDWLKRKYSIRLPHHKVIDCIAHVSSHFQRFENLPRIYQGYLQYIPRNMHTVFALLCFVVVLHWLIFPYPSGLLHWHCGNLTIAPVPAKQPWWIWINTSCEFIMNDCITTTNQSTTKPCAYFLGYTVNGTGTITLFFVVTPQTPMKQHRRI